ncbi:MAG: NAD+ synthase [bacterium]|nr:NAD+ synthase [bacterium]
MKITIAQLNPFVGDIKGNIEKIENIFPVDSDLLILPELYITGYPPRDLLISKSFFSKIKYAEDRLKKLSLKYPGTAVLAGAPVHNKKKTGHGMYNAAVLFYQGSKVFTQYKNLLPAYDVFDEYRYFDASKRLKVLDFKGERLGITICEDAWNDEIWPYRVKYERDPVSILVEKGATVIVNLSASPFRIGINKARYNIFSSHVKKHQVPFISVNQTGGNDELVFDGNSLCFNKHGHLIAEGPLFKEKIFTVNLNSNDNILFNPGRDIKLVYEALVLGVRDYARKCGFKKAVLGLSGGIDSAVVCCLASDAMGNENVTGIGMPTKYSSKGSIDDSTALADNLNVKFKCLPVSSVFSENIKLFRELFGDSCASVTMENIQARIRGNILMAVSNEEGSLLLSTGNKSEMAVGYCTLYGDMNGGLSVLGDVPKTMVYELAAYINRCKEVIPENTISKAPSAELTFNQKDQDSLPPYELLDKLIYYFIEENFSEDDLIKHGFDSSLVNWFVSAIKKSEYKRRQAPPAIKVTARAFGMGRRMPVASKYY